MQFSLLNSRISLVIEMVGPRKIGPTTNIRNINRINDIHQSLNL